MLPFLTETVESFYSSISSISGWFGLGTSLVLVASEWQDEVNNVIIDFFLSENRSSTGRLKINDFVWLWL